MTQETTSKHTVPEGPSGVETASWKTSEEVLEQLRTSPTAYREYQEMQQTWRDAFMEFCMGKRTLPLLYDPFFKVVFHPDVHPDRLSDMLSSFMGQQVKVKAILPNEDSLFWGSSLLVMDILVELEDGTLVNVEVQKIPYLFPAERMSCYSADLLLRQYSRVKGEKGKFFKYNDIHKVYTIIIYEKSTEVFHEADGQYIHHGRTVFDTGLKMQLLQEYLLIALDVFRENTYTKGEARQDGWLSLLSTATLDEAEENRRRYPWLAEIYREMSEYRTKPKEVLGMYSEALRILDRNTVQYMVEEQQKEIQEKNQVIEQKDEMIEKQGKELEKQGKVIEQKDQKLQEQQAEIARLKALLEQKK